MGEVIAEGTNWITNLVPPSSGRAPATRERRAFPARYCVALPQQAIDPFGAEDRLPDCHPSPREFD